MNGNRQIRLCLVSHTMKMGGMERVMAGYANYAAQKSGTTVHLVLLLQEEQFYQLDERVILYKPDYRLHEMPRWLYALRTLLWLRKIVRKISPDTVLSFGEYWNSFVLVATVGLPYPKYISDRSNPADNLKFVHEIVRRLIYPTASGFIAQTELAARIIKSKTGLANAIVVGNPVRKINGDIAANRKNIIVNVGRMIPYKQQSKLIEIFEKTGRTDWVLRILGDGPLFDELKSLVATKGIGDRVELPGAVNEIDDQLLEAKVFAFTSNYEGFPNALAEGMSAGLAPVSFDCPTGPADLIEDGVNGFLVPLDDDNLFLQRLVELMNDEVLLSELARKARESMQRFSEERVCEAITGFILNKKECLETETMPYSY